MLFPKPNSCQPLAEQSHECHCLGVMNDRGSQFLYKINVFISHQSTHYRLHTWSFLFHRLLFLFTMMQASTYATGNHSNISCEMETSAMMNSTIVNQKLSKHGLQTLKSHMPATFNSIVCLPSALEVRNLVSPKCTSRRYGQQYPLALLISWPSTLSDHIDTMYAKHSCCPLASRDQEDSTRICNLLNPILQIPAPTLTVTS